MQSFSFNGSLKRGPLLLVTVALGGVGLDLVHANLLLDDPPDGEEGNDDDGHEDGRVLDEGPEDDGGLGQGRTGHGSDELTLEVEAGVNRELGHIGSRRSAAVEDGNDNEAGDDERAEHVATADGHDKGNAEGQDRKVGEGQHVVARENDGQEQGDGRHEQREGDDGVVADDDGGVETDVELTTLEALGAELTGSVGDGHEALDEQGGHARHEDHDGGHVDAEGEDLCDAVLGEGTDDAAENQAEHPGLTEEAEVLLGGIEAEVNVADAGNVVEDPVHRTSDDHGARRGRRRQGHVRNAEVVRDEGLRPVGELEGDDGHDAGSEKAVDEVTSHKEGKDADGEQVVIVPDVNVHGVGLVDDQQHDVDEQDLKDDEGDNGRCPRDGRDGTPTHVEDVELNTKVGDHGLGGGAKLILHELDNEVDAGKADGNGDAGLEGLANLQTKHEAQDRDDDGQHHVGAGTQERLEASIDTVNYCIHVLHSPSFTSSCLAHTCPRNVPSHESGR